MSQGAAIGCGLLIGLLVVAGFLILGPLASDWGQQDAAPEESTRRLSLAITVLFGALVVAFVVAIFALETLQTVLIGLNMALTGVGALTLRRRARAGECASAQD